MSQPNRKEIKDKAKQMIKGNLWTIWKPLLIIAAIAIFGTLITKSLNEEAKLLASIIELIFAFIADILAVGYTSYMLKFVRGKKFEINDVFAYFKENLWLCILTGFLTRLFTVLWALLLIIPGIIAEYSYSMWKQLIVDGENKDAMTTIKASKAMMKGHKWDFFVFDLSFIGWGLLCGITFGIASIYVIPLVSTSKILYYEELKKLK